MPTTTRRRSPSAASCRSCTNRLLGLVLGLALGGAALSAQTPAPAQAAQTAPSIGAALNIERVSEVATFRYFNRPIVILRARIGGRPPVERAAVAAGVLDALVDDRITGPVSAQAIENGSLIQVGSRFVLGLSVLDVDELAGETLPDVTARTVARLQLALEEAAEARKVSVLVREGGFSLGGLFAGLIVLWALGRARRFAIARLEAVAERTAAKVGLGDRAQLRASRILDFQQRALTTVTVGLQLVVLYGVLTFALRQFPYTRPWGESMSGFLFDTLAGLGLGLVHAIPGLFTVFVIVIITRVAIRLIGLWFNAVERGTIKVAWMYPETARPTRRIVTSLLWVFAIVVAYPYLPGSGTDAFKGVSVFVGLVVSLGSSGLMNQIMSGFVVTFSRALRVGDYVKIGDVEGTVTQLGVLSTKVRTLMAEDVTIPHAVVVSQTATDYSRRADAAAVLTPIAVTIGYDAPWRQVHALLLMAAERTPGLRRDPKPHVLRSALEDFYVRYTLYVALDRQEDRLVTIDALNRNIQDAFNEYGVQIMSPNYVLDPRAPKVVPKGDWFAAPAKPDVSSHEGMKIDEGMKKPRGTDR